jgi:hypothetical protein
MNLSAISLPLVSKANKCPHILMLLMEKECKWSDCFPFFYQYQVQWGGVVSQKERSNNPAIICVNFHELNFNSLPLQT